MERSHLSDTDVLELRGERKHSKQLYLAEGGLEQLVIGLHGLAGQVVVAGNAPQVGHLGRGQDGQAMAAPLPR